MAVPLIARAIGPALKRFLPRLLGKRPGGPTPPPPPRTGAAARGAGGTASAGMGTTGRASTQQIASGRKSLEADAIMSMLNRSASQGAAPTAQSSVNAVTQVAGGMLANFAGMGGQQAQVPAGVMAEMFDTAMGPLRDGADSVGKLLSGDLKGALESFRQGLFNAGMTILTLPAKLTKWGDALLASQYRLAQFAPEMAGIQQMQQVRQITRGLETSRNTSQSTYRLMDSLEDLRDEMRPLTDAITNLLNNGVTAGIEIVNTLFQLLEQVVPLVAVLNAINAVFGMTIDKKKGEDQEEAGVFMHFLGKMNSGTNVGAEARSARPAW